MYLPQNYTKAFNKHQFIIVTLIHILMQREAEDFF